MDRFQMDTLKSQANEIFAVFERYNRAECSYDRALEDAARLIQEHSDKRSIVGYVRSGTLRNVFSEILKSKIKNPETTYIFDFKLHQNSIKDIERMYQSI